MKAIFDLDSKWTAHSPQRGWRHFRVVSRRYNENSQLMLELMAVCDRQVRFWVIADELKDKDKWTSGWLR